tara:strand:- start:471 stop:953 length:483 start_codon:yes stop_codon:yes gene_type:complete
MKTIDEIIRNDHESYKEYLTLKSKTGKIELDKLKLRVSRNKEKLKDLTEKYEGLINELTETSEEYEKDIASVKTEYEYKRKINSLLKKHNYLEVNWASGIDNYSTYVNSNDFDSYEDKDDPFVDHHYCDSYKEAYEMCVEYVKYHETNNKFKIVLNKGGE